MAQDRLTRTKAGCGRCPEEGKLRMARFRRV